MGKISCKDKMRIQTLRELGLGYRTVTGKFPGKGWKLGTVKSICKRVDDRRSAIMRKSGSGRPKMVWTEENINHVAKLICSQDDQPGMSKSTRQIAKDLTVSQTSVCRIAKKVLNLSAFCRVPAQVLTDATKTKRLERSNRLLRWLTVRATKRVSFHRWKSILHQPTYKQEVVCWSNAQSLLHASWCRLECVSRERGSCISLRRRPTLLTSEN